MVAPLLSASWLCTAEFTLLLKMKPQTDLIELSSVRVSCIYSLFRHFTLEINYNIHISQQRHTI